MNQLYRRIRIISLKRLCSAAFMLLISGGIFRLVPFYDFVWPVQITDPSGIVELYQNNITCVELTADTLYYSGYDYMENGRLAGSYYYSLEDGLCVYFLLSNAQCTDRPDTLSNITVRARLQSGGKLLSELIQKMSADLGWTPQGLSSISSHILVSAVDYLLFKNMVFLAIVLITFIISLVVFLYVLSYIIFPILHPACFRLRRYGSAKEQIEQAGRELCEEPILKAGIFTVTEHYLIASSKIRLFVLPLDQIIWVYKHSSFHHFRLKKLRITYTLRVVAKKKLLLVASVQPKQDIDAVICCISKCCPDVLIDYSRENERLTRLRM